MTFDGLFKGDNSPFAKYDPSALSLVWTYDQAATDEKYRNVLVKMLRFCYGEDQTFNIDECPVALTVLSQFQLKEYAYAEAIIVPQKYDTTYDGTGAAMQLIEITLPTTGIVLKTVANTYTFEKGKKYGYNVTVNSTELMLSSIISNWDDAGTDNIQAD